MKEHSIYKKALQLAIPMMIQNGITNAVGLVDNVMVGSLGTEKMTAVSIVGQLIFVFNLAIFGGLSGPTIYGAQYYGQKNEEGFKNIFRLKWWIGLFCLIGGISVFLLFGEQLISLYLHGSGDGLDPLLTLNQGQAYLRIMLFGLFPFVVTQIYAGSLRETGESVKPMIAGICSVVVDIILNYLLIYGNFGCPKMGVEGAAVATVIARFAEMAVIVVWSHKRNDIHDFLKKIYVTMKVPKPMVTMVLKKGFPIFLNEFLWSGGIAVLTQCYSTRGLQVVAGLNISNVICNLLNVVFIALGGAVGISIGQLLGASQYEQAKKDSIRLMWFTGAVCIVLTVVLIGISGVFPSVYDTSMEVKQLGQRFIVVTAVFFPLQGFLNSMYFTLRSGGKTIITFLFDSVFSWVVSVPVAFALCKFTTLPIVVVYSLVQCLDFIKVMVGYCLIRKGVWITNLVENE